MDCLDVVWLTFLHGHPFSNSCLTVLLQVFFEAWISSHIEQLFRTLSSAWLLSETQHAIVVTSHEEFIVSCLRRNEPSLKNLTIIISITWNWLQLHLKLFSFNPVSHICLDVVNIDSSLWTSCVHKGRSYTMLAYKWLGQVWDSWRFLNRAGEGCLVVLGDSTWKVTNFGVDLTWLEAKSFNSQVLATRHISSIRADLMNHWNSLGMITSLVIVGAVEHFVVHDFCLTSLPEHSHVLRWRNWLISNDGLDDILSPCFDCYVVISLLVKVKKSTVDLHIDPWELIWQEPFDQVSRSFWIECKGSLLTVVDDCWRQGVHNGRNIPLVRNCAKTWIGASKIIVILGEVIEYLDGQEECHREILAELFLWQAQQGWWTW